MVWTWRDDFNAERYRDYLAGEGYLSLSREALGPGGLFYAERDDRQGFDVFEYRPDGVAGWSLDMPGGWSGQCEYLRTVPDRPADCASVISVDGPGSYLQRPPRVRYKVYDNGGRTADRYSIYLQSPSRGVVELHTASENPYHPQGVGMYCHDVHGGLSLRGRALRRCDRLCFTCLLPRPVRRMIADLIRLERDNIRVYGVKGDDD